MYHMDLETINTKLIVYLLTLILTVFHRTTLQKIKPCLKAFHIKQPDHYT